MIRRLLTLFAAFGLLLAPIAALADPSVTPVLIYDQVNHAPAGTAANPIYVSGSAGGGAGAVTVSGNSASAVADTGNPVKVGSIVNTTNAATFTTGQRADLQSNQHGSIYTQITDNFSQPVAVSVLNVDSNGQTAIALNSAGFNYVFDPTAATWVRARGSTTGVGIIEGGAPASHWSFAVATAGIVNTTTAVTAKAAGGAGVRICVSNIQVAHDALGAVTEFAIRDGAAGTVLWRNRLQTTANEGATYNVTPAICGTANTLMEVVTLTAVTGAVYVDLQGYVSP